MYIETDNLKSVPSYARLCGISRQGVFEREKRQLIKFIYIDGQPYVDTTKYPVVPKLKQSGK